MSGESNIESNAIPKIFISWEEIHEDIKNLAKMIEKDMPNIEGIVLISRGGFVPAGILSYELDVKRCDVLSVVSYEDYSQKDLQVLKLPEDAMKTKGKNWVVVDELLDGGTTVQFAREILPESNIYVVYSKIKEKPSYLNGYVRHTPANAWINLPWDKE